MRRLTVGEVLQDRGLVEGSRKWQEGAAKILAGDAEWERLSRATPAELELDLGRIDRTKS